MLDLNIRCGKILFCLPEIFYSKKVRFFKKLAEIFAKKATSLGASKSILFKVMWVECLVVDH